MKIKSGFNLREIGTDFVVVPEGIEVINFNKLVSLNKTAKYVWENIKDKEFCVEDVTNSSYDEADLGDTEGEYSKEVMEKAETALKDAKFLIGNLKEIGLIDE